MKHLQQLFFIVLMVTIISSYNSVKLYLT